MSPWSNHRAFQYFHLIGFSETCNCQNNDGLFMHFIVQHKKQLSETETDIDICICGHIRDLVSSHPLPRAYFHPLPLLLFY